MQDYVPLPVPTWISMRADLRCRFMCRPQEDADRTMGWHILPPLTWHAFLWQEPNKPRAIEVAFAGALTQSHGGARHSEVTAAITKSVAAYIVQTNMVPSLQ